MISPDGPSRADPNGKINKETAIKKRERYYEDFCFFLWSIRQGRRFSELQWQIFLYFSCLNISCFSAHSDLIRRRDASADALESCFFFFCFL